jgi:hypothetical protein
MQSTGPVKDEEYNISFNGEASSPVEVGSQAPPMPAGSVGVRHRVLVNGERASTKMRQRASSGGTSIPVKQKVPLIKASKQKPPNPKEKGSQQRLPVDKKKALSEKALPGGTRQKLSLDGTVQQKPPVDRTAAQAEPQGDPSSLDVVHGNSRDPILKRQNVAEWLFKTQNYSKEGGTSSNRVHWDVQTSGDLKKLSAKRLVYLSDSLVQFPETMVGAQAMVKVRLCNRDTVGHTFAVIKPSRPFSVNHINFEIG